MRYYLAIDIGASSGRHIVGWRENGVIQTKEVYRFPNGVREENGHLIWDVHKLFSNVVAGILEAFKQYPEIEGLSIDTYEKLYIVGGGAKNDFLNRLTEEATGKKVIALPIEATALGNLKIQMEVK